MDEIEQEARSLGWRPQEEFKGDPEKWVDAKTFVDRGHNMMPLLKAENDRLKGEVAEVKRLFQASQEAIGELQKFHTETTKRAVEQAKAQVMQAIKTAREDGDVDLEIKLTDELADLRAAEKEAGKTKPVSGTPDANPPPDALHPDFQAWQDENKWFGVDERKTLRAIGIAQQLRAAPDNDSLVGRPFFDKVMQLMNGEAPTRTTKVGEGRPSGGGAGGTRGKGFADLPADAKEACARQGRKLIGEGRAFKDEKSWQDYYANLYFEGEAS